MKSVFELEGLHLSSQEALMVVVMEYCDLGALRKALKRRAFVPHGKWTFQTTYVSCLACWCWWKSCGQLLFLLAMFEAPATLHEKICSLHS